MKVIKRMFIGLLVFVYVFVLIGCKNSPSISFNKTIFEVEIGEIIELNPTVEGSKDANIIYEIVNSDLIEQVGEDSFKVINIGEAIINAWIEDNKNTLVEIKIIIVEETYSVKFIDRDGTKYYEQIVKKGDSIIKPDDPGKERFAFVGWYIDKEGKTPFDFTSQIHDDITLYAKWKQLEKSIFIGNDKYDVYKMSNNIGWSKDGFIYPNLVIEGSNKIWYMGDRLIDTERLVSEIGDYKMYFDENSTEIEITKKLENGEEKIFYSSNSSINPIGNNNLNIVYRNSLGEMASSLDCNVFSMPMLPNSFTHPKNYSIRYNDDNSLDILYSMGNFNGIYDVVPPYYNMKDFANTYAGNVSLMLDSTSKVEDCIVVGKNGQSNGKEIKLSTRYGGACACFDNDVALYILQNGLGTLEYFYDVNYAKENGIDDEKLHDTVFESVPEDTQRILSKEYGYWIIKNVIDESGKNKLTLGENCNNSTSPIKINPYITATRLSSLFNSGNHYTAFINDIDENGKFNNKMIYILNALNNEEAYLKNYSYNDLTKEDLNKVLGVGEYSYLTTDQEIYSYLQDDEKPGFLKVLTPNYVKTKEGESIYFDYNNDGIITENEKYIEGGYQGRDLQNNYLFIDENNYVFYFDKNGNRVLNDEEGIPHAVNSNGNYIPYLRGFTKEMYDEQQEKFNSYDESKPFEFEVAIRLKLCEEGLLVNVIQDSIIEGVGNNYGNSEIKDSFKHNLGISQFILFPEAPKLMSTISPFETILTENGILIKFTD